MMPHPIRRWASAIAAIALAVMTLAGVSSSAPAEDAFQAWLQSIWPEAEKLGVSRATFEAATRGLTPDLSPLIASVIGMALRMSNCVRGRSRPFRRARTGRTGRCGGLCGRWRVMRR